MVAEEHSFLSGKYVGVVPEKVVAVVLTDSPDRNSAFKAPDQASSRIAGHLREFLGWEIAKRAVCPQMSAAILRL